MAEINLSYYIYYSLFLIRYCMRYCYLISNFCMRCDSWIYYVWDMKVDSKILYEIWLLSVWNKKPDDCMRYDNAPFSQVFISRLVLGQFSTALSFSRSITFLFCFAVKRTIHTYKPQVGEEINWKDVKPITIAKEKIFR